MTVIDITLLAGIMLLLAAVPSASVALVVTRAATRGVKSGLAVASGIVLGDLVFILLAMLGLAAVAEILGSLFVFVKYLAGAYLLWLGWTLLTTPAQVPAEITPGKSSGGYLASFAAGLLLTLGDVKAIFFYLGLLPVFVDMTAITFIDALTFALVTVTCVGGVKTCYAILAVRIMTYARKKQLENAARKTAGGVMLGVGSYVVLKQ